MCKTWGQIIDFIIQNFLLTTLHLWSRCIIGIYRNDYKSLVDGQIRKLSTLSLTMLVYFFKSLEIVWRCGQRWMSLGIFANRLTDKIIWRLHLITQEFHPIFAVTTCLKHMRKCITCTRTNLAIRKVRESFPLFAIKTSLIAIWLIVKLLEISLTYFPHFLFTCRVLIDTLFFNLHAKLLLKSLWIIFLKFINELKTRLFVSRK